MEVDLLATAQPAALNGSKPVDRRTIGILFFVGVGFLGLGSLLPWFRMVEQGTGIISLQGGGGPLAWLIAVAILICAAQYLAGGDAPPLKWTLLALPLVNGFFAFLGVLGHGFPETNQYFSVRFDVGFYATCLGTILLVAGAVLALRQPLGSTLADGGKVISSRRRAPTVLIVAAVVLIPVALLVGYVLVFGIAIWMSCHSGC